MRSLMRGSGRARKSEASKLQKNKKTSDPVVGDDGVNGLYGQRVEHDDELEAVPFQRFGIGAPT